MPDQKKRTYQSTTLGLPPLKMVLVHARNEAQNAAARRASAVPVEAEDEEEAPQALDKKAVVRRLIQHLEAGEG